MAIRFIGAGLSGRSYTALTVWLSAVYLPTSLDMAAKWSEFASRFFLSFMLCFIGWSNQAAQDVNDWFIYFMAAIVFVVCVYVFAISGLPVPQQADSLIGQPGELIPAALCGIAFLEFLKTGIGATGPGSLTTSRWSVLLLQPFAIARLWRFLSTLWMRRSKRRIMPESVLICASLSDF